ncbi:MAG: type II secretion system F family protein, partial [Acidimicrobiales bacterium]
QPSIQESGRWPASGDRRNPVMVPALSAALVVGTALCLRAAMVAHRRVTVARRLPPSAAVRAAWRRWPRWPMPAVLVTRLAACSVSADPTAVWGGWLTATAAAVVAGWVFAGPGAALVAALVAVAGPVLSWRLLGHRADARAEAALPAVMDTVARGLRSGASLRQALAEAAVAAGSGTGELAGDLAAVSRACQHGATVVAALEGWAERRPLPGVRLAVAALCLGAETGGAGARAVDGVAATLRGRLASLAEARALATQARASAVVIAASPVAFCALASATDDATASFLFGSPLGLAMLGTGLALDAVGALWMAHLTQVPA